MGLSVLLLLGWLASSRDELRHGYRITGQQTDYLNLLVDGFQRGQLHLAVELTYAPPEAERSLRNPEPMLMDASYYQGRYYLYFGVVPVALLMLPYSALTGHDLSTNVVVLCFLSLGFLASLRAFHRLRAAYFPQLSLGWHALLVATLGLGGIQPFLASKPDFYEVVIGGAYAFSMLAALAVVAIYTGTRRPLACLAAASLFLGLAVGCRPTALLALPALALPAWRLWRLAPRLDRATALLLVLTLVGPALAVGLALATYNHARFGHPAEFGFSYSVNSFTDAGARASALGFIPANLAWYYFSLPSVGPYFPFFFPVATPDPPVGYFGFEPVHGQVWFTLTTALVALAWLVGSRLRPALRPATGVLLTLALLGLGPGALVVSLGFRSNRYLADFQPLLVLAVAGALGVFLAHRAWPLWRWTLALCLPLGLVATVGAALQQYERFTNLRPATSARLAHLTEWPARTARHLGLLTYGPIAFDVTFPPDPAAVRVEPLLTIGLPGYADTLVVTHHPGNVVEFHLNNNKLGGPRSAQRRIESGRPYRFTLETGAFYPPVSHYWGDGRSRTQRAAVKYQAIVTLDGETIINAPMHSNDAPPWTITLGRNTINAHLYSTHFSGEVTNLRRLPPTPPVLAPLPTATPTAETFLAAGWFTLDLEPPVSRQTPYPLLATGQSGAGNLLSIIWVNDTTFELALDTWGYGYSRSGPLPLPTDGRLQLDIVIPSLLSAAPLAANTHRDTLQVWLGSSCIWQLRVPAYLDTFPAALIGANAQGFSTGAAHYAGNIQRLPNPPATLADRLPAVLDLPPPNP